MRTVSTTTLLAFGLLVGSLQAQPKLTDPASPPTKSEETLPDPVGQNLKQLEQATDQIKTEMLPAPRETAPKVTPPPTTGRDPFSPSERMQNEAQRPDIEKLQQRLTQLENQLRDINAALSQVPNMKLKAVAVGEEEQAGVAWLEVGGEVLLVRTGQTWNLPSGPNNSVLVRVLIKQITQDGVMLEVGPWNQPIMVR